METRKLCSVYASAIPSISFCCYNLQKWLRLINWTYSEEIQCLSSTKAWFFLIKVTLTPKFTSDKPFTQKARITNSLPTPPPNERPPPVCIPPHNNALLSSPWGDSGKPNTVVYAQATLLRAHVRAHNASPCGKTLTPPMHPVIPPYAHRKGLWMQIQCTGEISPARCSSLKRQDTNSADFVWNQPGQTGLSKKKKTTAGLLFTA